MLRIPVTFNLNCVTPLERAECKGKPPHCFIIRNNKKVALVWLEPICIDKKADLLDFEKESVLKVVSENQYELEEAYRKTKNGW